MSVLELSDVKAYLNLSLNRDVRDIQVQEFIDAAEAAIGARVGPLQATQLTRQVRGRGTDLRLPVIPAISLTSVTPIGSPALLLSDLSLDGETGMVTYKTSHQVFWAPRYSVVYTAGWYQDNTSDPAVAARPLPQTLSLAVMELVRHFFDTQRGSAMRRPTTGASSEVNNRVPGAATLFPIRVEQLMALHTPVSAY